MTLRDEITKQIAIASEFESGDLGAGADAILALIREMLLSDDAVEAGTVAIYGEPNDLMPRDTARDAIAAAIDAITGEQP